MSWDSFSEWPAGAELELAEPFAEGFPTESRLFSTDHCITLDQPTDVTTPSAIKFTSHTSNFSPADHSRTHSVPIASTAPLMETTTTTCPCCKQTLEATQDVRTHVGPCFVATQENKAPEPRARAKAPKETESVQQRIDSIRGTAARMSLSQRIGLLESLSRLASLSKAGSSGGSSNDRSYNEDLFTLSLFFSSPHDAKAAEPESEAAAPSPRPSRKRRKSISALTVDVIHKSPAKLLAPPPPFFHEAFTPTTHPIMDPLDHHVLDLDHMDHTHMGQMGQVSHHVDHVDHGLLDSAFASTPPPQYPTKTQPSSGSGKRKRPDVGVVQALRFSPQVDGLLPSPHSGTPFQLC